MLKGKLSRDADVWRSLLERRGDGGMSLNVDMLYAYDGMFDLYPVAEESPLKRVAQHPAEDPWDRLGRKQLVREYIQFGIKEFYTLDAYLQAPYPVAKAVLGIARDALIKQTQEAEELAAKMKAAEEAAKQAGKQNGNVQ